MKKRKEVKTTFIAGTEWLYYKVYCGNSTADDILINLINPLACKLINTQIISSWFFIRYYDPEFHLRIRFNINQKESFAEVISELENIITPYFDKSLIWDIKINTYVREIERYGIETITDVEKIFFYDSKLISQTINILKEDNLRVMFAIKIVEVILNELQFSIDQKYSLIKQNREHFKKEFNANKKTVKQLDTKYRGLNDITFDNDLITLLKGYKKNISPLLLKIDICNKNNILGVNINYLTSSLIHMSINRLFKSEQRLYEFVIYEFLYKKIRSQKFKTIN